MAENDLGSLAGYPAALRSRYGSYHAAARALVTAAAVPGVMAGVGTALRVRSIREPLVRALLDMAR